MKDLLFDPKKNHNLHSYFQAKRLVQMFWAVEFTLLLVFVQRLYLEAYVNASLVFLIGFLLVGTYKLVQQRKTSAAATFLLSILTLFITYFIWKNSGVYDEAMFAYPSILIAASMFGNKKLFTGLVVFITLSIGLNGLANHYQWYVNEVVAINFHAGLLILLIVWLTSYAIWVMSSDFHTLLNRLSSENTKVTKSKKEIETLLHHDILTGLPNRIMAQKIFNKALFRAQIDKHNVCVMFIDIDNFKLINDGLGHQAGDALLKELAKRFKRVIRKTDTVCRLSGDEFVVILETVRSDEVISGIADSLITEIQAPYSYQNNELICSCSIGISVSPNDGTDFDSLIQTADSAMSYSKSVGGNSFHFFDNKMNTQAHDYLNVVSDLRKALKEDQFVLYFQPQFDLKNENIIGAEALIRWNHPEKGLIFPDAFIPHAEKSGLIVEIGAWVIQRACATCQSWIEQGYTDFLVAVNVSSQQFKRGNLPAITKAALKNSQLSAKHLEIEMTESLLIESSEELKSTLKELTDLGVTFSIDDFGTGYSNLSYLKEFEIETLKIDRSFISDIEENPKNKALVTAIIQMAKSLSLRTVAEGIENEDVAKLLTDLQCDYAQGFYWAKGLCEKEFIEFAQDHSKA